ncbi:hypothetical protein CR513_30938, partial [Mucuna pruriens]
MDPIPYESWLCFESIKRVSAQVSCPRPTHHRTGQLCRSNNHLEQPNQQSNLGVQHNSKPAQLPHHSGEACSARYARSRPCQIRFCRVHIGPISAEGNSAPSQESSSDPLNDLDPKIEITLCSFDNSSYVTNTSDSVGYNSTNNFAESKQMENNDRTLKELAIPYVAYQP